MGNHEYWGPDRASLKNLRQRFSQLQKSRWYTIEIAGVGLAIIVLDSNQKNLAELWQVQKQWYINTLKRLSSNKIIQQVIVVSHHPPFTNSTVTGDEIHVQRTFLPAFFENSKTIAWISGHAHAYEHFNKNSKHFIVAGGGGGPRVILKSPGAHRDLYKAGSPRPFHYLLITGMGKLLNFKVKGIDKGLSKIRVIDEFNIPTPR